MVDVFLSYSRRDQAFVHRLFDALEKQGQAAWVDWEGIPLTADWWEEIRSGIEEANTFVFVTSPNSLESPICHLELAHALRNNKRLVPVVIASPDEKEAFGALAARSLDDNTVARLEGRDILIVARNNWQSISRHNWLQFHDEANFDEPFKALLVAIETDLDYVREHTRLLVRAREWERNGRNVSFLLRDDHLRKALQWLETGKRDGKAPLPTPLHEEYIGVSKKVQETTDAENAATQRRVRTLGRAAAIGTVVALIAIALTVLAAFAVVNAVNQVGSANATLTPIPVTLTAVALQVQDGKNLYESISLAEEANIELNKSIPGPPMLLSIRALKTAYSAQADGALVRVIARFYYYSCRFCPITGHTLPIYSVSFSPDGKTIASGSKDQTVRLWDAITGKLLRIYTGHTGEVFAVAFSPDGKTILSGSGDQTAQIQDVATGQILHTFKDDDYGFHSVLFSPDGNTVLTGTDFGTAKLWDVRTNQLIRIFEVPKSRDIRVAFSPDGKKLLIGGQNNTARLLDASTGQILSTFTSQSDQIWSLAYSPDGKTIALGSYHGVGSKDDSDLQLWDVATGKLLHSLVGHSGTVTSIAFSPDGKLVVSGGADDNTAQIWDVASGNPLRTLSGHTSVIWSVAFSPDGKTIATGSWDNTVRLWNTDYRDLIDYACSRVNEDFRVDFGERQKYKLPDNEPTCPKFAQTKNPVTTPMPPTTTPLSVTLPAWTPMASPTSTATLTETPFPTRRSTATYPGVLLTFTPGP